MAPARLSKKDPMYDSEEEFDFEPYMELDRSRSAIEAPPSRVEFKAMVKRAVAEYFEAQDLEEVAERLEEAGTPVWHGELVKAAVSLSLDRTDAERELVSRMFPALLEVGLLHVAHFAKGFDMLCAAADDLSLDSPAARTHLSVFLARAVADECLPPSYLSDPRVMALDPAVVQGARQRLSQPHGVAALETAFDGAKALDLPELKTAIRHSLDEYFVARDVSEVAGRLHSLASPHFHHELVKRAVVLAVDQASPQAIDDAVALLCTLNRTGALSSAQVTLGFSRVLAGMADMALDNPGAPDIVRTIANRLSAEGALHAKFVAVVDKDVAYLAGKGKPASAE